MRFLKNLKDSFVQGIKAGREKKPMPSPQSDKAETSTHDRFDSVMAGRWKQVSTDGIIGSSVGHTHDPQTHAKQKWSLTLDVLDLTRVIDIYAESQAVQAFDAEMGKERKWAFQKIGGFFARSWQRIGRDAWIDTKKREYITKVKTELKTGKLSEQSLRDHITGGKAGI